MTTRPPAPEPPSEDELYDWEEHGRVTGRSSVDDTLRLIAEVRRLRARCAELEGPLRDLLMVIATEMLREIADSMEARTDSAPLAVE